ncbi:MAG: class I SAM-dependent methyltransferase [Lentisphaeria bacterium]|jgi:SAM-dependent methyltransferase
MSRRQRIFDHYGPRVHPERPSHEILDWASAEAQHARFDALIRALRPLAAASPEPLTLLDVGCGLADLFTHLRRAGLAVAYTGCDITPGVLAEARRRQPAAQLVHGDPFSEALFPPAAFAVVYASGVFNLDLGNNHDFLAEAVPRLFQLARRLLAINLLHVRSPHHYPHCHYYDPETVRARFATLPCTIRLDDSYLPNDFTLLFERA